MKLSHSLLVLCILPFVKSQAIEVAPGDFEPLPAGANALLLYYQHADRSDLYQNGHKVSDDARLSSDIGILRYVHAIGLSENLSWEPQILLPFGQMNASGDIGALGDTRGIGDPIITAPLKWTLPTANKDIFALAPYLYFPVGSYDKNDALNLGENRWRATLQAAYIHHFSPKWALDTVAEASWVSANNDFGPTGAKTGRKHPLRVPGRRALQLDAEHHLRRWRRLHHRLGDHRQRGRSARWGIHFLRAFHRHALHRAHAADSSADRHGHRG